ncbi:MAG: methionyl-tRNA formyltransferase [Chloroflexi bacterium]|nr:methionyl-tRNA formyltransferase [Chloroflexota bacterium]
MMLLRADAHRPRVVFMGSPEFALPTLEALVRHYPVVGVVTQPDRPAGRGNRLTPPPVKKRALELGLPIMQPRRLSDPQAWATLQEWNPDLIVVAAFGQILKPEVLQLPTYGCLNVHASLLPRWRGAAPIQYALLHGDAQTGVTIMLMDEGLDTGPILSQRATTILPEDTAASLGQRLAQLGAELLLDTLPPYLEGQLEPRPQDESLATYAPRLKRADGELDFTRSAAYLARQVRAFHPWPGTFMPWRGQRLKVLAAHPVEDEPSPGPGVRTVYRGWPAVGTADGLLVLDRVQPPGKRPLPGDAFLRGARDWTTTSETPPA